MVTLIFRSVFSVDYLVKKEFGRGFAKLVAAIGLICPIFRYAMVTLIRLGVLQVDYLF